MIARKGLAEELACLNQNVARANCLFVLEAHRFRARRQTNVSTEGCKTACGSSFEASRGSQSLTQETQRIDLVAQDLELHRAFSAE